MSTHTTEGGLLLVRMDQESCLLISSLVENFAHTFIVVHIRMTV